MLYHQSGVCLEQVEWILRRMNWNFLRHKVSVSWEQLTCLWELLLRFYWFWDWERGGDSSASSSNLTILNHLVHQQAQSFCHPWLLAVKVILMFHQLYSTAFWVQQNCQSCSFCKEDKTLLGSLELQTAGSASHPLTSWHISHFQEVVPVIFSLPKNCSEAYLGTGRTPDAAGTVMQGRNDFNDCFHVDGADW